MNSETTKEDRADNARNDAPITEQQPILETCIKIEVPAELSQEKSRKLSRIEKHAIVLFILYNLGIHLLTIFAGVSVSGIPGAMREEYRWILASNVVAIVYSVALLYLFSKSILSSSNNWWTAAVNLEALKEFKVSKFLIALTTCVEAYHFLQLNQKKLVYGKDKPPASYTGGILKIVVKNTGQGIIREDLEKLFQKFSQNCQELEYKKIGRGLELYITKEIIKAMYGEIRVYSKQGVGASFILCIPCKPTLIPQVLRPHSDPILPDKNRIMHTIRTMIVDDDSANTKVFEQYLAQKKIPTQCVAQNGLEAYERYKQQVFNGEPIELIIIDLNMPTIEGRTSCKRIRDYEKEHNLKPCIIIVVSGNCIESEMNECLDPKGDIQAHEFLRKPIQYEEFSAAVDRVANKIV